MEFQLSYFKSWKMMLWNAALSMSTKLENSAVATGLEKVSFHSNSKKDNAKECSNYYTIALISQASKEMLKILQARLQQYMNWELPDVQAGFQKGRGIRNQTVNLHWIIGKAIDSASLTMLKILTFCVTTNWKILKEMGMPDHLTCLLRNMFAGQEATGRTVHGTTNWFQIGRGVQQACILSACLFNLYAEYIMQNARLVEAQAGIKIARRNINKLICKWYHSNGRKWRGTEEPLDEDERGEWKIWLKTQHSKN